MKVEDYFKAAKAYAWKEKFAITKAKSPDKKAFANIADKDEITVIIDQSKIDSENTIEAEKDWKILTLDIIFPMNVIGVTAKIATALAKSGINIMPIAAYSKDHFLIKEKNITKAKQVFKDIGIVVETK